jgi:predicted flavoprotein YhiN
MTYPATGSTGDGYVSGKTGRPCGRELRPSLVGVLTEEDLSVLERLSLKEC